MMEDREKDEEGPGKESEEEIFGIEEITIEEMAIDGICGVY